MVVVVIGADWLWQVAAIMIMVVTAGWWWWYGDIGGTNTTYIWSTNTVPVLGTQCRLIFSLCREHSKRKREREGEKASLVLV